MKGRGCWHQPQLLRKRLTFSLLRGASQFIVYLIFIMRQLKFFIITAFASSCLLYTATHEATQKDFGRIAIAGINALATVARDNSASKGDKDKSKDEDQRKK